MFQFLDDKDDDGRGGTRLLIREHMEEISEEQKCIRKGQKIVTGKFEAIEYDCESSSKYLAM